MLIRQIIRDPKWTAVVATLFSLIAAVGQFVMLGIGTHKVIIASSPPGAEIRVDKKVVGTTPLTVELKSGTHMVQASKQGFESADHAIYVSANDNNIVNVQLSPVMPPQAIKQVPATNSPGEARIAEVVAEVGRIKSIVLASPEDAATVPILQEKMRLQREQIQTIRDELKDLKEQSRWYIGTVIAVIVGLLAVVATLFVSQKKI